MGIVEDLVLATSIAVSVGSAVVLTGLLVRYRRLTSDLTRASTLAKDIWDAMNSRLSVMDARIIDIMAKVEIYSARTAGQKATISEGAGEAKQSQSVTTRASFVQAESPPATRLRVTPEGGHEMEVWILRALLEGPRTSNQIRDVVRRSREHTARLMKVLYQKGLVIRNNRNRPYLYEITDAGRRYLEGN